MKNTINIITVILIAAMAAVSSCTDLESYSEIPKVKFLKVFTADTTDTIGNKVIYQDIYLQVIDGDGNLGLTRDDNEKDSSNLTIDFQKKVDGKYIRAFDSIPKFRIPYKQPIGQNKYLRAEVKVNFTIPKIKVNYDTIRYKIHVRDRAQNTSDTVITCDIPIRWNGTVYADGSTEENK